MSDYMTEVRCRSCHRKVAFALRNFPVYCDEICLNEPPATSSEGRDAIIEHLYRTGTSMSEIGRQFDLSRQAVQQIIVRLTKY